MSSVETKEKLLNAGQVAEILSLSKRTVHRLNSSGGIPKPVRINGAVRWREVDIEQWILRGCPDRKSVENLKGETQ